MKRIYTLLLLALLPITYMWAQDAATYLNKSLPGQWNNNGIFNQNMPAQERWWQRFDDTLLDSLISVAVMRNSSVLSAIESIRIAKASWRMARSGLFPTMDLNAGWQRSKTSGNITSTGDEQTWGGYFDMTASMSWQIDLFGSIYKRSQAQKHLFRASEDEYRAVMVSLCANVVTNYFSLRQSLAEMSVVRQNAESQQQIVQLVEVRYNTGLASKLDVAQARSVYYSTLASIPSVETKIQQYRNALAVLLAVYPGELDGCITNDYALPDITDPIAVGIPANLLLYRPDVRSAKERVEAYASQLGATKREWLPEFYLNGSIGFAATEMKELPRSRSMTWEIAPSLTWNLFDAGNTTNAERQAQAQLDQSIIDFNSTVLTAMQEVENAMWAYKNSIKQIVAMRETVNQGKETLRLSLDLYKQGLTQFQNVLDAQRSLLSYQNYLVQAQGSSLIYLAQLYEALGSGW